MAALFDKDLHIEDMGWIRPSLVRPQRVRHKASRDGLLCGGGCALHRADVHTRGLEVSPRRSREARLGLLAMNSLVKVQGLRTLAWLWVWSLRAVNTGLAGLVQWAANACMGCGSGPHGLRTLPWLAGLVHVATSLTG